MTLDEIRTALRAAGLERLADVAERLVLPAIRIEPTLVDEDTFLSARRSSAGVPTYRLISCGRSGRAQDSLFLRSFSYQNLSLMTMSDFAERRHVVLLL